MTTTSTKWARALCLLAALAVASPALVAYSDVADAKDKPAKFKTGKKDKQAAEADVKAAQGLGFLLMLKFDEIEGIAIEGDGLTVTEYPEGEAPPIVAVGDVSEATIKIELYQKNPQCIRCTHGGKVFEVCQN